MKPFTVVFFLRAARQLITLLSLVASVSTGHAALLPITAVSSAPPTYQDSEFPAASALTLRLAGTTTPGGSLQWLHDDHPIPNATAASLLLPSLSPTDAGNYRLRVTQGSDISYSQTFTVNVLPPNARVVDTSFSSQLPADYWVSSVKAFAADGSFIVQNESAYPALPRRVRASGDVVPNFNFPITAGSVLAGFSDGRLITSNAPFLLAPDGSATSFTLPTGFDPAIPLSGAAVTTDGKFYLSQGTTIVRFLANGSVDSSFSFTARADARSAVYTVDPQGRVYVIARRVAANPNDFPASWNVIYRLRIDGAFDVEFTEEFGLFYYGSARVKVVPLADGRIFHWSAYHGYHSWRVLDNSGVAIPGWSGGVFTDSSVTVDAARALVYVPQYTGGLKRYHLGANRLEEDTNFFGGVTAGTSFPPIEVAADGKLLVFTQTSSWEGHASSRIARIRTDVPLPVLPPRLTVVSSAISPPRGSTLTFNAEVSGDGPYTYQWAALDGQPLPANSTAPALAIPNFSAANFGRYQLRINGIFGTELSRVLEFGPSEGNGPYLANLSGRALPGAGENTMIAGFATKVSAVALGVPLLIRGVGPGLKSLGVTNALPNPALNLFDASGTLVANNDNWSASSDRDAIGANTTSAGAFALGQDSLDAALLKRSFNQRFTAQLFDQAGASGIGLLEIYHVPSDLVLGELINLSLRARTGPGEATAIAGFVIVDPQNFGRSARVLLRAVGPTLTQSGIVQPLADPLLTVYNAKGEVVAQNDDWETTTSGANAAELATAEKTVGAFDLPAKSKDAALLLDLPAGAYSMHATGGSGVVLMEVYVVR